MHVLNHEFSAVCSPEALWSVLSDLTAVQHYNPTVAAARLRNHITGPGGERECDLKPKGFLVERVFHWEEGRALGLEVVQSDWPVSSMRWTTRIAPSGSQSRVSQRLEYTMKFGPIGAALNALVMQRAMYRNVGATLQGFIRYAESRA